MLHVTGDDTVGKAQAVSPEVDALLLDSGNPNAPVKELGGTGRTHDWKISREIVRVSSCPVFLAGGLNSDNVRKAINRVQPFGIDVCSGVRTGGQLDESKLRKFISHAANFQDKSASDDSHPLIT